MGHNLLCDAIHAEGGLRQPKEDRQDVAEEEHQGQKDGDLRRTGRHPSPAVAALACGSFMEGHHARHEHVAKVQPQIPEGRQEPQQCAEADDVGEDVGTDPCFAGQGVLQSCRVKHEELLELLQAAGRGRGRRLLQLLFHLIVLAADLGLGSEALQSLEHARQGDQARECPHRASPQPQAGNGGAGVIPVHVLRHRRHRQHRDQHQHHLQEVAKDGEVQVRWHQQPRQQHRHRRHICRQRRIIVQQQHKLLKLQGLRNGAHRVCELSDHQRLGFCCQGAHTVADDAGHLHRLGHLGRHALRAPLQQHPHQVLIVFERGAEILGCLRVLSRRFGSGLPWHLLFLHLLLLVGRGRGPKEDQGRGEEDRAHHHGDVELYSQRGGGLIIGSARLRLAEEVLLSHI
mmetsp:Transcript_126650/g.300927  ORF Transcript_126650/g.300927 Transcript_126650/m.300927 type:complete len:401 (+) Transcript_126650:659-1861(+)